MTRSLAALLVAVLAVLAAPAALAAPSEYVPGEVLVKFRAGTGFQRRAAAVAAHAHAQVADLDQGWTHVRVRAGQSVEAALADYASDPEVEDAQPNFVYRATLVPDAGNTLYGQQWALRNTGQTVASVVQPVSGPLYGAGTNPGTAGDDIGVEPAWGVTTDCSGVVVAVIDTGVNYDHQDLAANMWNGNALHGRDFVGAGDADPMDENGHGTHVAGIIAADGNDGAGAVGVCWKARIMAVRALDQFGTGTTASILAGINFAVQNGAKILNMSLGGGGTVDLAYSNALTAAQNADVLVVVAAGNGDANGVSVNNDATPTYPCNFTHPNVLCVAALDQDYGLASFSNYGLRSVDVGAPGTNILSSWPGASTVAVEDYANAGAWTLDAGTGLWGIAPAAGTNFLVVPTDYITNASAKYLAGKDYKAFRTIPLASTASIVNVNLQAAIDVTAGDTVEIACRAAGGDPFAGGVSLLGPDGTGVATLGNLVPFSVDMTPCRTGTATLGFRLVTRSITTPNFGIAVAPFQVTTLTWNPASYNTIHGTSMATPVVAGVAALLRSYNPAFTFADTFDAITQGGRPVASLAGKTTSGNAVDAMKALAHLRTPIGLTAVER